jgi:hypothetical protein
MKRPEPSEERRRGKSEGAGGQPVLRSSLERFVYAAERTDEGVTARVGLPGALEAFHALGLAASCERWLRLKTRRRGPTEAEWVELLVGLLLAGGECPEDVGRLKEDDGLRRLWPVLGKVSARSALDFLLRFHDPEQEGSVPGRAVIRPETPALAALGEVVRDFVHTVQRHHPVARATLDVDASVHASDKKAALHTYEGPRGYQPVVAYWVEQRLVVADQFRDGNVPAGMGNADFVRTALARLPEEVRERYLRADSALYDQRLMRDLDRAGVGFAISADLTVELRAEIGRLPATAWAPLAKADGTPGEPGRQWAEVAFVPDDPTARKGERPYRYLAIKLPAKSRQGDLFDPPPPEYVALVTNRTGPGDALIHWHREKCGTIEHVHDWIKHDVGGRYFPSSAFGANAAWYRLAVLALNLFQALSTLALPEAWRGERLGTIRFRWLNRAGRVIRHARRYLVVLSHLAAGLLTVCCDVRLALARLAPS